MARRKRKLISEPITLEIDDLSHDGRGIARYSGKVMFVNNALPGEKIIAKHIGGNKNFEEAVSTEIIEPSRDRVEPDCQFYDRCNGCTMMHLSAEKQIEFKQNTLKQNLIKIGKILPEKWKAPLTDESWNYRRRARLSVRWVHAKEKALVGFREKNGRYVADMDYCKILRKPLDDLLKPLSELISQMSVKQHIAQIEASIADNTLALVFRHLKPLSDDDTVLLKAFMDKHNLSIYLQSKGPKTIVPLQEINEPLSFSLKDSGIKFEFLPSDFIQVNQKMNDKMITQALDMLEVKDSDVVLDLFCGLGNFTLPIAKAVSKIVGVEGDANLVERAKHNASLNKIDNVEFYKADLTLNHEKSDWYDPSFNKILIDPPRSGAWEILPLIAKTNADTLLYVSCHPASLARDTQRLVNELGFKLVEAGVMDMFPHTSHVESIALFKR